MKKDTLQVGVKGFSVTVDIELPESLKDVHTAAKNVEKYVVSKFNRGYRIDLQEGGARQVVEEMLAGKSPAQMQKDEKFVASVRAAVLKEIESFDPEKPRARGGRPAKPVVVELKAGKKTFTAEEVQAMLAAKNITTVTK